MENNIKNEILDSIFDLDKIPDEELEKAWWRTFHLMEKMKKEDIYKKN